MGFIGREEPANEYLRKYVAMARKFSLVGLAILALSVGLYFVIPESAGFVVVLLFLLGAVTLVIGASSLRPHNTIKSFAQLCLRQPDALAAGGLLEALERTNSLALRGASINSINMAIERYAAAPDADPEIVERLRTAMRTRVRKTLF